MTSCCLDAILIVHMYTDGTSCEFIQVEIRFLSERGSFSISGVSIIIFYLVFDSLHGILLIYPHIFCSNSSLSMALLSFDSHSDAFVKACLNIIIELA